jgi:hypothetical protein
MLCRYFEFTKNRLVPSYFFNIFSNSLKQIGIKELSVPVISKIVKIFEDGAIKWLLMKKQRKK